MYNYEWDIETGGYILLPTKITGVTKELRPVFYDELHLLGLDRDYGWIIPNAENPLMWAEGRRYFYRGELVAEATGGGLFSVPVLKNVTRNISVEPVDIHKFVDKNENILNGLVQRTLKDLYATFEEYRNKVDMSYVAFSGGKDSVAMLDIVQRALPHDSFDVVFGDTTMELGDTYKNVEKAKAFWGDLNWHIARTDFNATDSWKFVGPPARTIRWCCGVHKSAPSVLKIKEILAERKNCKIADVKNFKVLAFVGVRKEESEARSTYEMVSEGNKHAVQINCNPILEWSSGELFLYTYARNLPINRAYRFGLHRVGCILCPMSSSWTDFIQNRVYPEEVAPYIRIIRDSINTSFKSEDEWKDYMEAGGWKKRAGGKILTFGENRVTNITDGGKETFVIRNATQSWKKWMITLGSFVEIRKGVYALQHGSISVEMEVREEKDKTIISLPVLTKSKENIRFMYLFRNVLYKTAYCQNCKECMAECPNGSLVITNDDIVINNCLHCGRCLDRQKGCIVARSVITGGGNNMDIKNIDRYKTFGFRQEWLELYLEDPAAFWENDRLGVDMFYAFDKWAREILLIDEKKAPSSFVDKMIELGGDSPILWGYFYVNMAYNSPIVNWFIQHVSFGMTYSNDSLMLMLGDELKERTRKNALTSLKDTLRNSPIGWLLGQGEFEMKGKQILSITKNGWTEPDPIVILYSLYMFAERMEGMYSFTLSDLLEDNEERAGLSPRAIFGIERETLKPILQGLANNYSSFIQVDFNKGIMENIDLPAGKNGKKAIDVLSLI